MSNAATLPAPALSPTFDRARKLSRLMAVLCSLAFWVMLAVLVLTPAFAFTGAGGIVAIHGIRVDLAQLSVRQAIGAMVAIDLSLAPLIPLLHHARKLFGCFARGEVFAAKPIAHIRAAGLWLVASFFTGIAAMILLDWCGVQINGIADPLLGALFGGIAITIAAYVMEEARRIAADHAEII